MMYYTLRQNNSGGYFDYDADHGITEFVIVEGNSVDDIKSKLNFIINSYPGRGVDCPCCGDRWYSCDWMIESDLEEVPSVYGKDVRELTHKQEKGKLKSVAVHNLDGTIDWYHYDYFQEPRRR